MASRSGDPAEAADLAARRRDSVLSAAFIVVGLLLFLVPGFVCMILLAVVGPVIVIEDLGVWHGLKRSASLAPAATRCSSSSRC